MKERVIMDEVNPKLQTMTEYIKSNVVPAAAGRRCIDGRYPAQTEDSGRIARPGADAGYVLTLLALKKQGTLFLTPRQCFETVFEALLKMGEKFYIHTDHHATDNSIGCGHLAKAADRRLAALYGVDPNDANSLIDYVKRKVGETSQIKMVNLAGKHQEKAVLQNIGLKHSLNSFNNGWMYFVYDQTRDDAFIKILVDKMGLPGVTYEKFKEASSQQLNATLQNMAMGKNVFEVDTDSTSPTAELVKRI